jgi:retron-type reverse transcriptase
MHYAFDSWLEREYPTVEFERFADDAVVHCVTERQAHQVWAALADRLDSVGLRLHPGKTKIVYCGTVTEDVNFRVFRLRSWDIRSVRGNRSRERLELSSRRSSPR